MSLNKFTSADPIKSWMNIGCNSLKVGGFSIGEAYARLTVPDSAPVANAVSQYPASSSLTLPVGTYWTNDNTSFSSDANGITIEKAGMYSISVVVGYSQAGTSNAEYLGSSTDFYQSMTTNGGQFYTMSYHRMEFMTPGDVVTIYMASIDAGQSLDVSSALIQVNKLS
jgi:hypothetical protein